MKFLNKGVSIFLLAKRKANSARTTCFTVGPEIQLEGGVGAFYGGRFAIGTLPC